MLLTKKSSEKRFQTEKKVSILQKPLRSQTKSSGGSGLQQSKQMKTIADGRYELIREVGEGAYGRVLLSREIEPIELSDDTMIGEVAWKNVKSEALQGNFKT